MRLFEFCWQFFQKRSLRTKLRILYSLVIVSVLLLSSCFFYLYYRSTLETRSVQYAANTLRQTKHNIENNLEQIEQLSMIMVSSNTLQTFLSQEDPSEFSAMAKEVEKQCIDVMVSRNDIESILIYAENNTFVGTNRSDSFAEEYEYIKASAESRRGRLGWLYLPGERPAVLAVRTVYSTRTFQPIGLLVIRYRQSTIDRILANEENTAGQIYLLDRSQRIIASSNQTLLDETLSLPEMPPSGSGNQTLPIQGEPCLVNYSVSSYNDWVYLSALPRSELDVGGISLLLFVTATLLFSTCLGVFFSNIIAKSVAHPVQQLVTHLQNTDIQQLTFAIYNDQDEFSYLFKAYNDMLSHIHELVKINYEQKILRSEMELKILHMQLNPHFLYNTLDTLYYMALDCNNNDLAQITKSLADMLRYSISESCAPLSCVADEIRHAENYCTIQKIRLGEKLQFYFDIDELLLDQKLPRLSLQPFLENCIRHGYGGRTDQVLSIEVKGLREGDQCVFQITDDGIGLDDCAAKKLSQRMTSANFSDIHEIAIPNVNEQLKLLFGERGKITFEAHNLYGGATFRIIVPFCSTKE